MESFRLAVPAMGREAHEWRIDDGVASRRARERGQGTYSSSIPARIADLELTFAGEAAAAIADAEKALVEFDEFNAAAFGHTGQALGPMASILLRSESASSSQIENLTVGARQLALAEIHESSSANAGLVLGNVRAMEAALDLSTRLELGTLLRMHEALLPEAGGVLRSELVWVGRSGISPVGAEHVAPKPELVEGALTDLLQFSRRTDIPVLPLAAIAHAQFETIHPFFDGNGRTGRALVHSLLRHHSLVTSTTVPVSAGLLRDVPGYIEALTAFRAGDAWPIIERFCEAAHFAASEGRALTQSLISITKNSRATLRDAGLRSHSHAYRILDLLVGQPVLNTAFVTHALGITNAAAIRALTTLADHEIVSEATGKKRGRVWQSARILDALDDFARKARRGR